MLVGKGFVNGRKGFDGSLRERHPDGLGDHHWKGAKRAFQIDQCGVKADAFASANLCEQRVQRHLGRGFRHHRFSGFDQGEQFSAVLSRNLGQRKVEGSHVGGRIGDFGFWKARHLSQKRAAASNVGPHGVHAIAQARIKVLLERSIVGFVPFVRFQGLPCGQHGEAEGCGKLSVAQHVIDRGQVVQGRA